MTTLCCGRVAYCYRMGKYEVSAAQRPPVNTAAGIGNAATMGRESAAGVHLEE